MSSRLIIGIITSLLVLNSCIHIENSYSVLPPGPWRGVLKLPLSDTPAELQNTEYKEFEQAKHYRELPFNFDVVYTSQDSFHIEIINGTERIVVSDIRHGIDRKTAKDTMIINFPAYDTYIKATYEENFLEGFWHVNYKDDYKIPFIAYQGQKHRFSPSTEKSAIELSGDWKTTFDYNKDDPYGAIGVFKQDGEKLSGTFKTETGDYRFLEGTVQGEKFFLSCFDGSHAFLFTGKKTGDQEIIGKFYSGKHYESDWIAVPKTVDDELGDPFELTKATTEESIQFEFKNADGKMIDLADDTYAGKPKLINIMGTWCPNCRDETDFLKKHYKKIQDQGIEVISICFERYKDEAKSLAAIKRYQDHMEVPWNMLYGGYANKKEAAEKVPFIEHVLSYPTLLFVDKNNKIQHIHTGFNGPATKEFKQFEDEFYETLNTIN